MFKAYKPIYFYGHQTNIVGWSCPDCGARVEDVMLHNDACPARVDHMYQPSLIMGQAVNDALEQAQKLISTYSGTIGVKPACDILEALKVK